MNNPDVVIIGAGASGMMCAIEAGKRGRRVLLLDHANKAGKKILMSGGGRCNFTNFTVEPENYISRNPHFCKSALSRYTQWDFLALVDQYQVPFHEREHGQLFCDNSAKDIVKMLLNECRRFNVRLRLNCSVEKIRKEDDGRFVLTTRQGRVICQSLVIATGGLSIPKIGASAFGYHLAKQFSINIIPTRAALVPLTWQNNDRERYVELAGIAVPATVSSQRVSFSENILFTHRGLSGPAILQISSYWIPGESVLIDLLPGLQVSQILRTQRALDSNARIKTVLARYLPKRLLAARLEQTWLEQDVQNCSDKQIDRIAEYLHEWRVKPNGTEGYRTAEVTSGGIDCDEISSKTMESHKVPGLFVVGEVMDVTGWLGGYNFQWAWSSGWSAGQYV